MCICGLKRIIFRNGTLKSSINTGRYAVDYLLCGNPPYPAWKKHISVQNLSNRRIRRYLVCRLKRPEARDFSHVRFTKRAVERDRPFIYCPSPRLSAQTLPAHHLLMPPAALFRAIRDSGSLCYLKQPGDGCNSLKKRSFSAFLT